jgi:hypothetical protein
VNSIKDIKIYNVEEPIKKIWKELRYFKDVNYTLNLITSRLKDGLTNEEVNKHKDNIYKQSNQIKNCIQQAEEYFVSSNYVGLSTKPVLLYYGIVCLSQALYLFKKSGTYSLDYLRNNEKHNHHGLIMTLSAVKNICEIDVQSFLNQLNCKCFFKG